MDGNADIHVAQDRLRELQEHDTSETGEDDIEDGGAECVFVGPYEGYYLG